jgi:hypothetical protein
MNLYPKKYDGEYLSWGNKKSILVKTDTLSSNLVILMELKVTVRSQIGV